MCQLSVTSPPESVHEHKKEAESTIFGGLIFVSFVPKKTNDGNMVPIRQRSVRYLLHKQAEQRQRVVSWHLSHQLREALHRHRLTQTPEGRAIRRAVRGQGQHPPRIGRQQSHQGASRESVIWGDSLLSFLKIPLQILKQERRKAFHHSSSRV